MAAAVFGTAAIVDLALLCSAPTFGFVAMAATVLLATLKGVAIDVRKRREDVVGQAIFFGLVEVAAFAASFGLLAGGLPALAAFACLMATVLRRASTSVRAAQVEAVPGALVFRGRGGELRLDVATVDSVTRPEPRLALLRQGRWTVRLRFDEEEPLGAIDALLARIPVVSGERATVLSVTGSGLHQVLDRLGAAVLFLAIPAVVHVFAPGASPLLVLAQALAAIWVLSLLVPLGRTSLTLGEDGLLLGNRGTRTFVPYARIRSVEGGDRSETGAVRLHLEDGESMTLAVGPRKDMTPITAQIEAHRQRYAAADVAHDDRLARAGRPLSAWRADLERPSAFRTLTPSLEELRTVLASPTAPLEERVGAALALRRVPGEGHARIRVAAGVTAHPELRVALEAIAEEELDEIRLESALALARRALR